MFLVTCDNCGALAEMPDDWVRHGRDWYCPSCAPTLAGRAMSFASAELFKDEDIVGFDRPEDGSEDRYLARRHARPWLSHTAWWWVHNAIAHPLIAFLPFRACFRFHDWTSRRMHGR